MKLVQNSMDGGENNGNGNNGNNNKNNNGNNKKYTSRNNNDNDNWCIAAAVSARSRKKEGCVNSIQRQRPYNYMPVRSAMHSTTTKNATTALSHPVLPYPMDGTL